MTDIEAPDPDPDAERIREAAAAWIARVERRPSASLRRDLDRWLAADPRHAAAHRRMSQHFEGARMLRTSRRYAARPQRARRPARATMAVAGLAIAAFALVLFLPDHRLPSLNSADQRGGPVIAAIGNGDAARVRRFAAPADEIRSIGLADGSVVTLDDASVVEVAFAPDIRRVTLLRGRARFTVAHDGRPFTVFADGGSVTARGTVFDVSLSPSGQVGVALLRGIVDVAPTARAPSITAAPPVRRLLAGEAIGYANGGLVPGADFVRLANTRWADGAVEFDNVSLAFLLDRANQHAGKPITVADPSLATLRVSGRFKIGNPDRLADNLAKLFDLRADVRSNAIVLRRE